MTSALTPYPETNGEKLVVRLGSQFVRFWKLKVDRARSLGTVAPSSRFLARNMVNDLRRRSDDGLVIELGPGNGVITKHILEAVENKSNVMPIEISPDSIKTLNEKFPLVKTVNDCAANMEKHIPTGQKVKAIISALPLRVMPKESVSRIGDAIHRAMGPESIYVQYTYDIRPQKDTYFKLEGFKKVRSKIVWRNLPPARVDVFVKK